MPTEPRCTEEMQHFIVRCFAAFKSPQETADAVKEEFDIELSRQAVSYYRPENHEPGTKWRELHDVARAAFLESAKDIAIAQMPFRMDRYNDMARYFRSQKLFRDEAAILEQAARDLGGMYTNRREHTGANGSPLAAPSLTVTFEMPQDPEEGDDLEGEGSEETG